MKNLGKNVFIWITVGLLLVSLFNFFGGSTRGPEVQLAYSEFLDKIKVGEVNDVMVKGNEIHGHFSDGRTFTTYSPNDPKLIEKLNKNKVMIKAAPPEGNSPTFFDILISWFPMLLLIGVWIFFMRQMQAGGGKAMGFGKSKARMMSENTERVTFKDVAGIDEAKQEVEEIVEYLKDPQKFQKLGGKIPKGALLVGAPGTGKTLLARAIAGEAKVPFFIISGSDFVEMFVGVGASRVRDMFEQGKKNAPCIIFIDEIDAVGRHRGAGLGGGNDEREQTLNQLLVEMDGFDTKEGVILIAATNRPDVLDPALLRPGRFDRQVVLPSPDILGREKILNVHMKNIQKAPDVNPRVIARGTPGFSGADLANLVNESALLAARRSKKLVTMLDFEDAKDKILMGAERRSLVMSEKEKELTAYHEAGHALVGIYVPGNDPLHKVTIIPRGRALGVTMNLPERDRYSETKKEMEAKIAMMFGGRAAEEIVFGKDNISSGAANDIKQASDKARRMVTEWGMSKKLGPLRYHDNEEEIFLGHSVAQRKNVSDATAELIDQEVKEIVEAGESKAREVLTKHRDSLDHLARALLEHETLTGDEVNLLVEGKDFVKKSSVDESPSSSIPSVGEKDSSEKKEKSRDRGIKSPAPQHGTS